MKKNKPTKSIKVGDKKVIPKRFTSDSGTTKKARDKKASKPIVSPAKSIKKEKTDIVNKQKLGVTPKRMSLSKTKVKRGDNTPHTSKVDSNVEKKGAKKPPKMAIAAKKEPQQGKGKGEGEKTALIAPKMKATSNKKRGSSKKSKKPLTKQEDKEYQSLYRKILRRKKKVSILNEERKRGYKTQRTRLYKEIVGLNKDLKELIKERGYKLPENFETRQARLEKAENWADKGFKKRDKEAKTITYSAKVWEFEEILSRIINSKTFKTIELKNVNKKFGKKSAPSTILYWYDIARDTAYQSAMMSTPFVEVVEDYTNSIISIEVIS